MARKWIQKAIRHKGALRRTLKVKKGKTISVKRLRVAARRKGVTGRRARLALVLRRLRRR